MTETLLSIRNLSTCFDTADGEVRAVDNISLDIRRGETLALLGESGCGKSMTAFSLMRLVPAPAGRISGGQVVLDGVDLLQLPEVAMRKMRGNRIAMIFQEPMTSLNPVLTIGDQIGEAVRHHDGDSSGRNRERVIELLDAVGIPEPQRRLREYPHQLSGGMKQRVMIAIALAGEPELLIADEPTTALDVTIQAQVLELLRELQRKTGMAILMITHDLGVVSEMADQVAVMYAGQIVEQASRDDFFAEPRHPYSRKLFESLPDIDKRDEALAVIHGSVPPLLSRFSGCRFADRCDYAWADCQSQEPLLIQLDAGPQVRCHLFDALRNQQTPATVNRAAAAAISPAQGDDDSVLLDVQDLKIHFPIHKGLLRRTAGYVYAVDGVSLKIRKGRTLALVGESGCGKTTIGKGILQLIRPTAGQVMFDNDELTRLTGEALRKRRADIQIIFQDPYSSMNPRMMVKDIIQEGMVALAIETDTTRREARVDELLTQVGLPLEAKHRYPHEFSGGQRQRICIARALAVNPQLIICDEPTSALDVSVQAQILNQLKELQQQMGLAYLFITHNLSVVAYLADEVAVMYLGRIVEQGRVSEVLQHPRHPYTRALLSAIPVIDQTQQRQVIHLEGDLPSPSAPPPGCHFHARCQDVMPQCREAYPAITRFTDSHFTRCYLYQQE
jgi:peptide/nickel transport system ATP-binding protein